MGNLKRIATRIASEMLIPTGYLRKWVPLAILIGVAAGISSITFTFMLQASTELFLNGIASFSPPSPAGEGSTQFTMPTNPLLIPIVTTIGGLISGLLVYSFAPEAEGHGTDAVIDAFHNKNGEIRTTVAPIKIVASSVTIGSGGSAGREGPIALTCAALASLFGKLFKLSPNDRLVALTIGMGAGIGSIFKAPFGGALLAAEILYIHDFEVQVLVPAFISSVVAYSVYSSVLGWQPIFRGVGQYFYQDPASLLIYGMLGVLCGLVGIAYVKTFYGFQDLFARLDVPKYIKPAIGGLAVGIIGMFFPYILGTGYGWLQLVIEEGLAALPITVITAMIVLKIVATALTVGSGGSGGVFAPSLVIGGMIGAVTWAIFDELRLTNGIGPAPFVLLGMMSFFGGVGKVPVAVILMVSEMTGTYNLLVPSMVSTVIAYTVSGRHTIYKSQVRSRADSPAHQLEYVTPILHKMKVRDAMSSPVLTAKPSMSVSEVADLMANSYVKGLPVIDDDGRLVGVITFSDVLRVLDRRYVRVDDVMNRRTVVAYSDEPLYDAFKRMMDNKVSILPVLDSKGNASLVGILTRSDVIRIYEANLD